MSNKYQDGYSSMEIGESQQDAGIDPQQWLAEQLLLEREDERRDARVAAMLSSAEGLRDIDLWSEWMSHVGAPIARMFRNLHYAQQGEQHAIDAILQEVASLYRRCHDDAVNLLEQED